MYHLVVFDSEEAFLTPGDLPAKFTRKEMGN
jgi:hypothetical protein